MRNINKISSKTYFYLTVISSLIAMMIYRATIFRCLFFSTFNESKVLLWLIWGACLVVTYLITFKRRRNYFSLFTNTVLPFGIYSLMAYEYSHSWLVTVTGTAMIAIGGLYLLAVVIANDMPDNPHDAFVMLRRRITPLLSGIKSISAVCLSVLIIYVFGLYAFDSPSLIPAVKPVAVIEEEKEEYLEKNLPVISNIDDSVWSTLSFEDRLDVLQTLANAEKSHLGISHEVNVCAEYLGWGTLGCYDDTSHTVTINTEVINDDDPTDAVTTLCHELRHAFQHDVTDAFLSLEEDYKQLAIFDEVRKYYENLDDYQSASTDGFDEYESQTVEVDSREYSEERAAFYFWAADKHLAKSEA